VILAQQSATQQSETHPSLTLETCSSDGCSSATKSVVIDANWRWVDKDGTNCYEGQDWDSSICPATDEGAVECAENCAIEGATYEETYGISTDGDELTLGFVTKGSYGDNVGSRTYMMADDDTYEMFYLKNKEFTFTVDTSSLPCGLNGALYFVEMAEDGGKSAYDANDAGAKYGTGYCDAQCPQDLKFINGEANVVDWEPSDTDVNTGTGNYGSCCTEMDIWEANSISQALTPHTCDPTSVVGQTRCDGEECGDNEDRYSGMCDRDGCDYATYRLGETDFYGPGSDFTLDSSVPLTVVTQFITDTGTDDGELIEIRRLYVQNGEVVSQPEVTVNSTSYDSITDDFCKDEKAAFLDSNDDFTKFGGLSSMGAAMGRGMVLVMSLWDDHFAHMLWLDSDYPTEGNASSPGVARGTCDTDSGNPEDVESDSADASVKYSAIKIGSIGSTFSTDVSLL